ncbi:ABC-2 type transport system permease protein [Saccharopolyspora lacisalsi]|uniref:ABC-2 type transport system permease protein n=1 Tax=Halosaccharopolyspora lacisalsi TaxID=1000566 RepID=A0A839DUU4_9PSEU|nr:ABC transporter permease [Halosaccharopolyspora lacisalsi]MBA8824529.1 ABC-2 type transport system permease protein [Halosaccharopolyspora lacisalsi]
MNLGYLGLEMRRALRAPGTLLFTIGFPAVFYLLETMLFEGMVPGGSPADDYAATTMIGMSAWGVMTSGLLVGTRVVHERVVGWQRQLRLTPLTGSGYLLGKTAVGMFVALPTAIAVPLVAVLAKGVTLDVTGWFHATLGVWAGSLPFAVLGLLIGQWANKDNVQNFTIVGMLVLAMFGGLFMPLGMLPPWWTTLARFVPSYWLAEIGRAGIQPGHDALLAAMVLAGWGTVLSTVVVWRYRRDSARL